MISQSAEVSIITCAPGNELYSTFGHSAIRVKDSVYRFDKVYNYGTFNFETPNFYLKFGRGQLDYMLSVSPYKYFVASYMDENRWIKEQVLNLTDDQKKEIYLFLENNALPENKFYRYDFFYDNCATRVKDVVKDVLGSELIPPGSITENGTTFRDMLKPYLIGKEWERFGISLILGQPADKQVTPDEATFLPDFTELYFDNCTVKMNGAEIPLVKSKQMLYEPKTLISSEKSIFTPAFIFWLVFLLFLIISFIEIRKHKYYPLFDKTLYFILGLAGIVILLMWFATDHKAVVNNWDILWCMPLYMAVAFMIKKEGNKAIIRYFLLIWSLLLFISIFADLFVFNMFDIASLPLLTILILRGIMFFRLKR